MLIAIMVFMWILQSCMQAVLIFADVQYKENSTKIKVHII